MPVPAVTNAGSFLEKLTAAGGGLIGGLNFVNTIPGNHTASTSAESLFDQNFSIPANTLRAGSVIKIHYQVNAVTTVGSDTLIIKLYIGGIGGTALQTSNTTDAVNADLIAGDETIIIRTAGASGTLIANGNFTRTEAASGTATRVDVFTASTAVNTAAAQVIGLSATWNSTNANTARLDMLTVEIY